MIFYKKKSVTKIEIAEKVKVGDLNQCWNFLPGTEYQTRSDLKLRHSRGL